MSKRFKTQDYAKFKKLGTRWRKPSGRQSKLRVKKTGSGMLVKIGYRTSRKIRIQNMEVQIINNINELNNKAILIAGSVGLKKAKEILEKANQLGIKVLNARSVKDRAKLQEKKKAAMPKAVKQVEEKKSEKDVTEQAKKVLDETKEEKKLPEIKEEHKAVKDETAN